MRDKTIVRTAVGLRFGAWDFVYVSVEDASKIFKNLGVRMLRGDLKLFNILTIFLNVARFRLIYHLQREKRLIDLPSLSINIMR